MLALEAEAAAAIEREAAAAACSFFS